LLRRLSLSVSHRALIERFKLRSQRYGADALRAALQRMGSGARREDFLALRCAEYLFDEGLNPLFNAQIVRLRPDLFDSSLPHTLYVEAKQYSEGKGLRAKLRKACWQIWSTWSELEGQSHLTEGFLLVFRLGGPLVTFDTSVRFENRTLYPVLVDLAPNPSRGHAEKIRPIHIGAAEMIPAHQV
jgi:hypothetical protein